MISKKNLPYFLIVGIVLLFFYKTILFGKIPFAGDLLLSQYAPWRHVSYFGYVAGAIPSKDQYFDVIRELYPWKTESLRQIKEFTIPLWNPYNFSGTPLLANYQSQIFYPLNLLYLFFPQIQAWTVLIILQFVLGGIFVYLFAVSIGMGTGGALITSIAFNFSSFSNVWMEFNTVWHTILWLPLLLYVAEKSIQNVKITIGRQMVYVFALFSAITAGHPQDFINLCLYFWLYFIIRIITLKDWTWKNKLFFSAFFLLLSVIAFFLASPQLIPTIELFRNSARVPHDYQQVLTKMLIQPWQLGLVAVQDFFGNPATKTYFVGDTYVGKTISIGIVGLFLSFFSFNTKKLSWHHKFFAFICLGLLLFTTNTLLSPLFHRYPLPVLSTGAPTRILFLFCFSLSILAGFGFDALYKAKKIIWKPVVGIGIVLAILWTFALLHPTFPGLTYTQQSFFTMKKAMLFSTALIGLSLVCIISGFKKQIFFVGLIALVAGELLYGFNKFNPFVPKEFVYPENPLISFFQKEAGIDRIWGYGTAQIEANFTTQYRLFSTDGTDPLNLKWYNEFIQASRDGNITKTFNRTTRSDAQLAPGYGERDLPDNPYRLRIMDALGVKYIIDRTENPKNNTTFSKDRFKEIWHKDDWTVYENLKSAPRFFLTGSFDTYKNPDEFERKFFSPEADPSSLVLLREEDRQYIPSLQIQKDKGSATLISYKPNEIRFRTESNSQQILYISDVFDYGWQAAVDGMATRVLKANYAFRAVVIPPGTHTVVFSYQPESFLWGIRLMVTGMVSLIFLFSFQLFWRRKKK